MSDTANPVERGRFSQDCSPDLREWGTGVAAANGKAPTRKHVRETGRH
jgi:hypothetical protein